MYVFHRKVDLKGNSLYNIIGTYCKKIYLDKFSHHHAKILGEKSLMNL